MFEGRILRGRSEVILEVPLDLKRQCQRLKISIKYVQVSGQSLVFCDIGEGRCHFPRISVPAIAFALENKKNCERCSHLIFTFNKILYMENVFFGGCFKRSYQILGPLFLQC